MTEHFKRFLGCFFSMLAIAVIMFAIVFFFYGPSEGATFQSGDLSCTVDYTPVDSDTVNAKIVVTNTSDTNSVIGAWYTVFYDDALTVTLTGCSLNGVTYDPYDFVTTTGLDWMSVGTTLYRVAVQAENDIPYDVAILPLNTFEITYSVSNAKDVEKVFDSFWVGHNGEGLFGWLEKELDLKPPAIVQGLGIK